MPVHCAPISSALGSVRRVFYPCRPDAAMSPVEISSDGARVRRVVGARSCAEHRRHCTKLFGYPSCSRSMQSGGIRAAFRALR